MLNHHDRYAAAGGFDDANSSQRILMGDRPIFKIFINPKPHCKAHAQCDPFEYQDGANTRKPEGKK